MLQNKTQISQSYSSLNIPSGVCNEMNKNITLQLSKTRLEKINDGFMDSPYLNCLNLEENHITEISPNAFKFLPNLYYLSLARNSIPTSKLFSFNGHFQIKTLILDENIYDKRDCNLTMIDKSYFPSLENLYLRKNKICNFTGNLKKHMPRLTHLYLTENNIESIEFSEMPTTLTHIYLEENSIIKFNATMIKNIEFLALDENKIQMICNTYCHEFSLSLNRATNLKYLSLHGNDVIFVEPDAFDDTINLISLDLSKNKIATIRKGTFNSVTKLQNLSLSNNILKTMPDLSLLKSLQSLNLSDNKLEIVSTGEFGNLFMLKILSLSNNLLTNLEVESFGNLISLEELYLSNNKLYHLPTNWLTASEKLRILDLRGNCFADLRSLSLGNMESLEVIFLQKNPVKYVNTGSFFNLPRNMSIYLEDEYRMECSRIVKSKGLDSGSGVSITKGLSTNFTNRTPFVERVH